MCSYVDPESRALPLMGLKPVGRRNSSTGMSAGGDNTVIVSPGYLSLAMHYGELFSQSVFSSFIVILFS